MNSKVLLTLLVVFVAASAVSAFTAQSPESHEELELRGFWKDFKAKAKSGWKKFKSGAKDLAVKLGGISKKILKEILPHIISQSKECAAKLIGKREFEEFELHMPVARAEQLEERGDVIELIMDVLAQAKEERLPDILDFIQDKLRE